MTAVPLSVGRPRRASAPAPRRAQPRPRPQLSVVDVDSRRRAWRVRWAVRGLVVLVVAALLSAVGFHVALAQGQVRLDGLERDVARAEQRYDERRLAYAEASSPAQITARAQELGLVPPAGPAGTVTVAEDAVPPAAGETSSTIDHQGDVKASASP